MASGAIDKRLGFMHIIQQELVKIGKLLQEPDSGVPSFLDYLLPTHLLHGQIHEFLALLFNVGQGYMRPCRLIIYIDDLDRCKPEKVVEVLESLVLLTGDTPFIIFLAIDPGVIVQAVETVTKGVFSDVGVNGHDYLNKLVSLP